MIDFLLGVPGKLKAISDYLTTNWTTTRAAKLDYLTANVAVASTALDSTVWTSTKAGYVDAAISGRLGSIKTLNRGQITIASGTASNTATITAVNTAKSICLFGGARGNATAGYIGTVELTNSTTVTAQRVGSPAADLVVGYTIVEFN